MDFNTALIEATKRQDLESVREALRNGADVNAMSKGSPRTPSCTSLMCAASLGAEVLVHFLLENGADIHRTDRWGNTALACAVSANHSNIVRLLIEQGADARLADNSGSPTILQLAIHNHNREMVEMLLDAGADINRYGYQATSPKRYLGNFFVTPLSQALYDDELAIAELLVERGADVNASAGSQPFLSGRFHTTLEFALAQRLRPEILRRVLEWGATPDWSSERLQRYFAEASPEVQQLLRPENSNPQK